MENTDKTLLEMQEQMKQLKDKLDSQKIVNDRILRKSYSQTLNRLKFKANLPIIFAVLAILSIPSITSFGVSWWFVAFTWAMMLICIVATVITNAHIPRLDRDMVSSTRELTKFRKIHTDWLKISIPMLVVWIGLLLYEILRNSEMGKIEMYGFIGGILVGVIIGGLFGLKLRRDQMDSAEDLISQIEDLNAGE